jgi:hypothetical protein
LSVSLTSCHIRISSLGKYTVRSQSRYNPNHLPLSSAENCNDPEERFMRVLSYYLAGWHIKPKGVKKPSVPLCFSISSSEPFTTDTTQFWVNSSAVDTTIQMAPKVSTLPSKAGFVFASRPLTHLAYWIAQSPTILQSPPSSTFLLPIG